jgi:hypothetical protein
MAQHDLTASFKGMLEAGVCKFCKKEKKPVIVVAKLADGLSDGTFCRNCFWGLLGAHLPATAPAAEVKPSANHTAKDAQRVS